MDYLSNYALFIWFLNKKIWKSLFYKELELFLKQKEFLCCKFQIVVVLNRIRLVGKLVVKAH